MDNQPKEVTQPIDDTTLVSYSIQAVEYDIPRHYILTVPFKPNPYHTGKGTKGKRHKSQKIRSNKRKHG